MWKLADNRERSNSMANGRCVLDQEHDCTDNKADQEHDGQDCTPQTTDAEDTPSRRTIIWAAKAHKNMQPATEKIHTTKESICNLPLNKYTLQKNQDRFTMISDGKREIMTIIFRVDQIIFRVVKIIIRIFREPFISFRLEIAESHYVRATQQIPHHAQPGRGRIVQVVS